VEAAAVVILGSAGCSGSTLITVTFAIIGDERSAVMGGFLLRDERFEGNWFWRWPHWGWWRGEPICTLHHHMTDPIRYGYVVIPQ